MLVSTFRGKERKKNKCSQVFTVIMFPQAPASASTSYQTMSSDTLTQEQLREAKLPENGSKPEDAMLETCSPTWRVSRPQISSEMRGGGCWTGKRKNEDKMKNR